MAFSLKKLFGINLADAVSAVGNAIDRNITNTEEREQLKQDLTKILLDNQQAAQQELTKRLETDMSSDSWLSKNIRPISLIYLTIVVSILTLLDGNIGTFHINIAYIDLFKSLLIMAFTFYFGSRGMEKIIQQINKPKIKTRKKDRNDDNNS